MLRISQLLRAQIRNMRRKKKLAYHPNLHLLKQIKVLDQKLRRLKKCSQSLSGKKVKRVWLSQISRLSSKRCLPEVGGNHLRRSKCKKTNRIWSKPPKTELKISCKCQKLRSKGQRQLNTIWKTLIFEK